MKKKGSILTPIPVPTESGRRGQQAARKAVEEARRAAEKRQENETLTAVAFTVVTVAVCVIGFIVGGGL